MLDLNIPTTHTITATVSPHDAEILQHSHSQHIAAQMSSSLFGSSSSTTSLSSDTSGINLTQQLADTMPSSSLYPMVNVASNFIYDWCNQSSASAYPPSSSSSSDNGATFSGYNCSLLASTNGWNTSTNNTAIDISFILPWWRQVLWSILYGVMVIVATGGNLIVVWIVITTKRMRTVTNYFIVNLSIADAMVSSLNVTFNYIYMLDNDWPFGELYCKISQFIATLSISASVFTLMAISIDRYVAIMKPLKPRMSKRSNLAIAAAIWIASAIISCPMLLFFTTEDIIGKDGIRTVCYSEWPDGTTNHSNQEYSYNILFMILTYFLPVISMTATYSRVGLELWGSKAIGEYTPRQVENVKSKRRVVKMMMVVVLIFAVCWLPFHAYFIVTSCYPAITETPFIQEVYLFIYWLAMSNCMYNPIIYCWMNSRFRFGFKMFFRWCPFVHIGAESLNRRDNMTSRYSCSGSPDHNRIKRNDTQRSFLYTCPGSPKSRRISHCDQSSDMSQGMSGQGQFTISNDKAMYGERSLSLGELSHAWFYTGPKSRVLRSSTILTTNRDASRHSAPITGQSACNVGGGNYQQQHLQHHHHHHLHHHHHQPNSSYHQRCSQKVGNNVKNSHELAALSGNGPLQLYANSKDYLLKPNVKWTTTTATAATAVSPITAITPPTEAAIVGPCPTSFNGVADTNYLANRTALMS